jgi:hypothetical protein
MTETEQIRFDHEQEAEELAAHAKKLLSGCYGCGMGSCEGECGTSSCVTNCLASCASGCISSCAAQCIASCSKSNV